MRYILIIIIIIINYYYLLFITIIIITISIIITIIIITITITIIILFFLFFFNYYYSMVTLYVCVLCASCFSSQCCVRHDFQFVKAGRGCNRRPYRRGILQSRSHNCFIVSHEYLLLFTPSCCSECFHDL